MLMQVGGFLVLICHFEGIRSLIIGRVFHFIFVYKILNISLTSEDTHSSLSFVASVHDTNRMRGALS